MGKLQFKGVLVALTLAFSPISIADIKTLMWEDLVPADMREAFLEEQAPKDINALAEALTKQAQEKTKGQASAPVVVALDNKEVKLPGYIVPLDMRDDGAITEFLLVPYFGACVHVPPPPPNQVVHVIHEKGLNPDALYDPFWITGTLSITGIETELAQAGYTMKAKQVELYTEPTEEQQQNEQQEKSTKPKEEPVKSKVNVPTPKESATEAETQQQKEKTSKAQEQPIKPKASVTTIKENTPETKSES